MASDQDTNSEIITHVQSNPWGQDAVMTKLCTAVPSICESLIRVQYITTVNTQHMQAPDVLLQLGYTYMRNCITHVSK